MTLFCRGVIENNQELFNVPETVAHILRSVSHENTEVIEECLECFYTLLVNERCDTALQDEMEEAVEPMCMHPNEEIQV